MQLTLKRYRYQPDWTIGRLYVNQQLDGYVIEDEVRQQKVHGETAIPEGVYKLALRDSPKFSSKFLWSPSQSRLIEAAERAKFPTVTDWEPHKLIWLQDVPGFQYILIHYGNTDDDTEGCLIVGKALGVVSGQEAVVQSRVYYKSLYPRLYAHVAAGGAQIHVTRE